MHKIKSSLQGACSDRTDTAHTKKTRIYYDGYFDVQLG